jgi:hypothetical protein
LSGQPPGRREMLRLIVVVDTLTPSSSSNASQCSSSVRSGLLRRWSGNHSLSIAALMAGGPDGGLAPTSPVSLRLLSQRLIEGSEIPKILATSALGIPRSTASNTLTLRSSEYALMQDSFVEDQASRKPLSVPVVATRSRSSISRCNAGSGRRSLRENTSVAALPAAIRKVAAQMKALEGGSQRLRFVGVGPASGKPRRSAPGQPLRRKPR